MTESVWETPTARIWQWVLSGVDRGMTATAALGDYRAAGMHISNEVWYADYKTAFGLFGISDSIRAIPKTYTVGEQFATESDYDWGEKYVMQMKVRIRSRETGEIVTRWVTAESESLLSRGTWMGGAQEALDGTPGSLQGVIEEILDYHFYRCTRY